MCYYKLIILYQRVQIVSKMLRVDTGQWYTITYESIIETTRRMGSIFKLGL